MSFIKNYGLYWRRDQVEWGSKGPGNSGKLRGYAGNGKTPVDFRAQAGVYVLYDGADIPSSRVTYIGQVGRSNGDSLYARLYDHHARDHLWNRWTRFSWFGVFAIGKKGLTQTKVAKTYADSLGSVIDHLEGVLITVLEPPLNKRGANWDGATQCFQHLPAVVDPVGAQLEALAGQIAELRGRLSGE